MAISMYQVSAAIFARRLNGLAELIARVEKTIAYDIIRHNGVQLGKRDFMGAA